MRIVRYALIPDSEVPDSIGSLGLRRDYTFEGEVVFSVLADAAKFAPWLAGPVGSSRTIRADPRRNHKSTDPS